MKSKACVVLCLALVVVVAAQEASDELEMFSSLAQTTMARFNASSVRNGTMYDELEQGSLSTFQLKVARLVFGMQLKIIVDSAKDYYSSTGLALQALADSNAFDIQKVQLGEEIDRVRAQQRTFRKLMRPSQQLMDAQREVEGLQQQTRGVYALSHNTTATLDNDLAATSARLDDLKFIGSVSLSGYPGRVLLRRFGGRSLLDKVVDRSLNEFAQMDSLNNNVGSSNIPEQSGQLGLQNMLQIEEVSGFSFVDSLRSLADSVVSSTSSIKLVVESVGEKMSYLMSRAITGSEPSTASSPASSALPAQNNNLEGKAVAAFDTQANIQVGSDSMTSAAMGEDGPLTIQIAFPGLSLSTMFETAGRSFARAAGLNSETNSTEDSVAMMASTLFGRPVSQQQLATTMLEAEILHVLSASDSDEFARGLRLENLREMPDETPSSTVVDVVCSQGRVVQAVVQAVLSGAVSQALALRFDTPVLHATLRLPHAPLTQTLLSVDEGSSLDKEQDPRLVSADVQKFPSIFNSVVKAAELSRRRLLEKRDKILQPYAAQLRQLQKNLAEAEAKLKEVMSNEPVYLGELEILDVTLASLTSTFENAQAQSKAKQELHASLLQTFLDRQKERDNELVATDTVLAFTKVPPSQKIVDARIKATKARMAGVEKQMLRASLQRDLKTKQQECESFLSNYDRSIAKLYKDLELLDMILDIIESSASSTRATSLLNMVVLALSSRDTAQHESVWNHVQGSMLLSLGEQSNGTDTLAQLKVAITQLRQPIAEHLDKEIDSKRSQQQKCDTDIARMKQEIAESFTPSQSA